ncbi:MAG TPA: hypothetical protein VFX18_06240 [Candidatus Nitrosocosmicus sp.]|nr:hypothetical protein [Candidatus Nitrosocosmicus sp.]
MKQHNCCKAAKLELKYDSLFHRDEWSMQIGIRIYKVEFCPWCGEDLSKIVIDV